MPKQQQTGFYTFLGIFFIAIFALGNWFDRSQSAPVILAYFSAFLSYVFVLQKSEERNPLLIAGFLARIVLFFHLPILSDDLYRFIWDGTLIKNGLHPFEALPSTVINQNINGLDQALFDRLNSPDYFTIYPPLNQFIFWLSVTISQGDWLFSANIIRTILAGADIGSFLLLERLLRIYGKSHTLAFWYWLNPLVILEFTGNLHFEGLVIFFVLAGIYFFERNRRWVASLGFGLAIGTKLLPLIYLPYLFLAGIRNKRWHISILAGVMGLLTLAPLLDQTFISAMTESLDLYFRSFEFNASLYFIARAIGYWIYGYNNIALIGPLLSILSLLSILTISIFSFLKKWSIPKTFLFILTAYLFFATTVHPWYIIPLIVFGLTAGYWYPIIWSFLIFLTYLGYSAKGFELPMYIIVIEYVLTVLVLLVELKYKKK